MNGPGKPITAEGIQVLLCSEEREDRIKGLILLVQRYAVAMQNRIRRWSHRHRCGFNEDDVEDVWGAVVETFMKIADKGKFKQKWSLGGTVGTVTHRRSVDLVRKRVKMATYFEPSLFDELIKQMPAGKDKEHIPVDEQKRRRVVERYMAKIRRCYDMLSVEHVIVLKAYIKLRIANGGKRVSRKALVELVSESTGQPVEPSTVRSRVNRAKAELRRLLKERGDDE